MTIISSLSSPFFAFFAHFPRSLARLALSSGIFPSSRWTRPKRKGVVMMMMVVAVV